ncbi:TetR/AcrR family transcriptional regulator [Oceanibacterium hippocampi]|uniref:Transcriptional regulator BetI n=1 Tax=Oceanibacterium hippocampi TaxID=745714 RepID=A0A1Y5TVT3_9PROT|nr:TetR/AcrR family transcriptional regulator [Oceanibacterium hippocampi]SLN74495.1 transcriptional regulator BetI [Oceanibacterium hippocampi]
MARKAQRGAGAGDGGQPDIERKVVEATMALVGEEGWSATTLNRIADRSGVGLAEIRRHFRSRPAILEAFARHVDEAVLAGGHFDADEPARDRLFDVLMRRFDALAPHKEAIRRLAAEARRHPLTALSGGPSFLRSMTWMLAAAGIGTGGLAGMVRARGLGVVYLRTLTVWLDDESEDLGRTMSTLDKALKRAEAMLGAMPGCRRTRRNDSTASEPQPA